MTAPLWDVSQAAASEPVRDDGQAYYAQVAPGGMAVPTSPPLLAIKIRGTVSEVRFRAPLSAVLRVEEVVLGHTGCASVSFGGGAVPGSNAGWIQLSGEIQVGDRLEIYAGIDESTCSVRAWEKAEYYIRRLQEPSPTTQVVRVQVYDSASGRMLPGATVWVEANAQLRGTTDSRGEVALSVPAGNQAISASLPGYSSGRWSGTIAGAGQIAIPLNPVGGRAYGVRIQVYDTDGGAMLPGASVWMEGKPETSGITDGRGEVVLSVPSGNQILRASLVGYLAGQWQGAIAGAMGVAIPLKRDPCAVSAVISVSLASEPRRVGLYTEATVKLISVIRTTTPMLQTMVLRIESSFADGLRSGDVIEVSGIPGATFMCLPSQCNAHYIKKSAASGANLVLVEKDVVLASKGTTQVGTASLTVTVRNGGTREASGTDLVVQKVVMCCAPMSCPPVLQELGRQRLPKIAPGSKATVRFSLEISQASGAFSPSASESLTAIVNPERAVAETSYEDNAVTLTISECGDQDRDQDQDGLPDWKEALAGTNPERSDTDGDGLTDGKELNGWSVANLSVRDESSGKTYLLGDLIGGLGVDGDWGGGSDIFPEDYNGDGKSDLRFGNFPGGFLGRDADGDGDCDQADEPMITYLTPLVVKTDPLKKDTDRDGIPDASDPFPTGYVTKWEICVMGIENVVKHQGGMQWTCYPLPNLISGWYGQGYWVDRAGTIFLDTNVGDPRVKPYLIYDGDGDGISLLAETCFNTLPELRRSPDMSFFTTIPDEKAFDSDDDGRSDLQEILAGTNPRGDIAMAKALLFVEATLLGGDASGAAVSVYLDIRDLRGLSEDGKNGWITIWVASSVGIGKELIPNLDAGFQRLPVGASLEEDPALPDGAAATVLFLDTDLSIHFNPQLSFSISKELCHFDAKRDLLKGLGLESLLVGMAGPLANLVRGARFLNWLGDNLGRISAGKYPEGVRDAAVSGKSDRLTVETDCPVELEVIDPDGLACSKATSEITDGTYLEGDFDGDGETEDRVTIENRKIGDYRVAVSKEDGAAARATYSLRVTSGAGTVEIARDTPVPTGSPDSYRIRSGQGIVARVAGGVPLGLLLLPVLGILAVAVSIAVVVRARRRQKSIQLHP